MENVRASAPVIVGVDGSSESHQALAWAMEFASIRKAPLLLLTAYRDEGSDDMRYGTGVVASLEARSLALAGMFDRLTASGIEYEHIVSDQSIRSLIRDHAEGASMVVLGSGPRHRWHQRLRPSLARRLNGRVACPVLSIPSGSRKPSKLELDRLVTAEPASAASPSASEDANEMAMS